MNCGYIPQPSSPPPALFTPTPTVTNSGYTANHTQNINITCVQCRGHI